MNEESIQAIVEEVISRLHVQAKEKNVPIAISARHCHLSTSELEQLFGKGYELTKRADLSQTGQFAAKETVTIVGPKGSIERVRILGPARNLTQVEISKTDSIKLGIKPPIRQSGDLQGSSPITIVGPKGSIYLNEGLIIAQAHIHMNPEDANRFNVRNGEYVAVTVNTERPFTFEKVLIRVSSRYKLEMHIDTDEANAGDVTPSVIGVLNRRNESSSEALSVKEEEPSNLSNGYEYEGKLLTHRDVQDINDRVIFIQKSTIITPLARDSARDLGKVIEVKD